MRIFSRRRTLLAFVGATAGLVTLSACGKALTYERWSRVELGESREQIHKQFGKPLAVSADRMTYVKQKEGIAVEFHFDPSTHELDYTEWSDPVHGVMIKSDDISTQETQP